MPLEIESCNKFPDLHSVRRLNPCYSLRSRFSPKSTTTSRSKRKNFWAFKLVRQRYSSCKIYSLKLAILLLPFGRQPPTSSSSTERWSIKPLIISPPSWPSWTSRSSPPRSFTPSCTTSASSSSLIIGPRRRSKSWAMNSRSSNLIKRLFFSQSPSRKRKKRSGLFGKILANPYLTTRSW